MDLLVGSMRTWSGSKPDYLGSQVPRYLTCCCRHCGTVSLLGRVLSGKGWTRAPKGHKDVSLQQADPQWYMERDAKPASCGTTLRAPAPAGIFFWILVLSPL